MLNLEFRKLDIEMVNTISKWRYSDSDKVFYMKPYQDSYLLNPNNIKGPGGCDGYGVYFNKQLFGIFEYKFVKNELEIGCALAPRFKGKGYGAEFVLAGIGFGISEYHYSGSKVQLTVDVSNIAARKAYTKVGFEIEREDEETIWMFKEI